MNAVKAGLFYFLIVFAIGFALGTIRTLWLAPMIGPFPATLIELPIILTASWYISGWLIYRLRIAANDKDRLMMGAVAFGILMIAELLLGLAFGRSLADQWSALQQPAGLAGFAGQALFGLMPWIRLKVAETKLTK